MRGQLVSRCAAADILGVSVRTFDRMLKSNQIPYFQERERCKILINTIDLERYIKSKMRNRSSAH